MTAPVASRPFWKRWWVIAIAVVVLIAAANAFNRERESPAAAESSPSEVVEVESSTPVAPSGEDITAEIVAALQPVDAAMVTSAARDGNAIDVQTTIVDPRGDDGSPEAVQAVAICDQVLAAFPETSSISVLEADGTTFAQMMTSGDFMGHPAGTCFEY